MTGGLVALVRLPDATWLALPFLDAVLKMRTSREISWGSQVKGFFVFCMSAAIVFLPQMVVWQILNTSTNGASYPNYGGYFYWFTPKIFRVLFSLRHGFFLWHPVLFFAASGLVLLYRKDRSLTFLLGFMFVVQLYIVSAWYGWFGGHSFGNRMLINSLPALALGLAALIDWAAKRNALRVAGILAVSLIVWNALFFAQYRLGYISKYAAISFHELILGKFTMLLDMANRIQHMFR